MRKLVGVLALVCLFALPMLAQDNYKAEVFAGYQYFRVNPGAGISGANFNGWNGSVTANMNSWLGVTADLSGAYKSESGVSLKMHNFLFGPTVSYNKLEKFKPFAHALFGVSHASAGFAGGSGSDNAFASALGGGVDVGVSKSVAIRLIQADYFLTRFGSESQNNARISTGIIFRF